MRLNRILIGISILVIIVIGACYFFYFYLPDDKRNPADKEFYDIWEAAGKLSDSGKIEESLRYADSMYARHRFISPYGMYLKYAHLGVHYKYVRKLDSLQLYTDSSLYILEHDHLETKYALDYTAALIAKGDALREIHNYAKAYDYYFKAKLLAQKRASGCYLTDYSYSLGMTLFRQRKFREAAREFEDGFTEATACPIERQPYYRMQELLSNTALCFTELNITDSAISYYDSAIVFIGRHSKDFGAPAMAEKAIGVIYGNMATIYFNKGSLDTAEELMKKSIAINVLPAHENRDAQKTKMKLAYLYFKKNETAATLQTLTDLRNSLDTLHDLAVENEWKKLMYQHYVKANQPLNAFGYYTSYIKSRDSLTEANKGQMQSDILREMNEKDKDYQIRLLKKDNEVNQVYLWVTVAFSVLAAIIVALVFITYRRSRKQNKQINSQNEKLEKSNKEKDRILNIVAHDLRSPVGSIAFLVDCYFTETDPAAREDLLEMIKKCSVHSMQLINDLVGYTNEDSNVLNKQKTDMAELVKDTVGMMSYRAIEKQQQIEFHLPDQPLEGSVDQHKIARVITNLTGNAIKFSREGEKITISLKKENNHILLAIQDNGIGIPKELQRVMFDMFTAAKRSGTSGEQSFGLGLSISKQIIEAHGGKIWVESTEGKGSTFYVQLLA